MHAVPAEVGVAPAELNIYFNKSQVLRDNLLDAVDMKTTPILLYRRLTLRAEFPVGRILP